MSKYILFLLLILSSCKDQKIITSYYSEGQIKELIEIAEDSTRQGLYLKFAKNGDTIEKSFYSAGKLDGKRILYFDDNRVEIIEEYKEDSLDGKYQVFYKEGGVSMETQYDNNVLNAIVKRFYPSGELKEEVSYENNIENGPFVEYYETGSKKWEGNYRNGDNEIGLLLEFAENGDTIKKMMCDDRHICTTLWRNPKYNSEE